MNSSIWYIECYFKPLYCHIHLYSSLRFLPVGHVCMDWRQRWPWSEKSVCCGNPSGHSHKSCAIILIHQDGYTLETASTELFSIREARFEKPEKTILKHASRLIIHKKHRREVYRHQEHASCHAHFSLTWMRKRERFEMDLQRQWWIPYKFYILMNFGCIIKY